MNRVSSVSELAATQAIAGNARREHFAAHIHYPPTWFDPIFPSTIRSRQHSGFATQPADCGAKLARTADGGCTHAIFLAERRMPSADCFFHGRNSSQTRASESLRARRHRGALGRVL